MKDQIIYPGMKIAVTLIDPWDFVTQNGSGPFNAAVLRLEGKQTADEQSILIQLDHPVHNGEIECRYFVGKPRHEGSSLGRIFDGIAVGCTLTCISEDRAIGPNPFDLSWWRGGLAIIADVNLPG